MAETVEVVHSTKENTQADKEASSSSGGKDWKKIFDLKCILLIVLGVLFIVALVLSIYFPLHYENENSKDKFHDYDFEYWTKDAKPIKVLREFLEDVTKKGSDNYIPFNERVAVFDMDGTIIGEKAPTYLEWVFYSAFIRDHKDSGIADYENHTEIVRRIDDYIKGKDDEHLDKDQLIWHAKAFKEWTIEKTEEYIDEFVKKDVPGFKNLKYEGLFFKPMIEIINFLQKNFFKVVIVTGSERFWVRHYVHKYAKTDEQIPRNQFIGADIEIIAKGETKQKYYDPNTTMKNDSYVYTHDDITYRSGHYLDENMYMGKVRRIIREIGIQPVLAFGNSGGDVAMMNYATTGNKYRSQAFMLVADDREREYGVNEKKEKELKEKWTSPTYGYQIISMRDDWKTIYGKDVTITNK